MSNASTQYNRDFIYHSPEKVLFHPDITLLEFRIYSIIRSFMDTTGSAYPSNNWIAKRCDADRRSIIRAIKNLESMGLIKRFTSKSQRYLIINYTPCPEKVVTQMSPPSDTNVTPPSDTNVTQLDQSNINIDIDTRARETGENLDTCTEFVDSLKSPPLEPTESDHMSIDPNYQYPETYFPMSSDRRPSTTDLTVTTLFEVFFALFPMKKGKERARQQWIHDGCEKHGETIINKLRDQMARDKHFKDGFVPSPWKYIVERRYEDEVFEGKKHNKKSSFDFDDTSWRHV